MKDFFKKLFSNSPEVSGKRVGGLGGWAVFCGLIIASFAFHLKISDQQERLMSTLAYTSSALILGGAAETIFKGKQKPQ